MSINYLMNPRRFSSYIKLNIEKVASFFIEKIKNFAFINLQYTELNHSHSSHGISWQEAWSVIIGSIINLVNSSKDNFFPYHKQCSFFDLISVFYARAFASCTGRAIFW
jgi:hypothetical protein